MTKLTKKDQIKTAIVEFLNAQKKPVRRIDIDDALPTDLGSVRTISRALAELKTENMIIQEKEGKSFTWKSTMTIEKDDKKVVEKPAKETKAKKSVKKLHDLSKMKTEVVDGLVDKILEDEKKKPTKANIAKVRTMLETTNYIDKLEKATKKLTKDALVKAGKKKSAAPKPKKETKVKKPGVIATIIKSISKKRRSKKAILAVLVKAFPERESAKMLKTINVQVPSRLKKDKGLTIDKNDKGYKIVSKK